MFTTSPAGFELIERFEGLHKVRPDGLIEAYKIAHDPVTIGIGQTGRMPDGRKVEMGLVITEQEARDALQHFVRNVTEPLVRKHFNARTQAEFDALVSWTYNISSERLEAGKYSLPSLVNPKTRDIDAVISKWIEYKNPGTIFEQGLYRRRLAELCMFLGLPWHFALGAILKRSGGIIVDMTPPDYILQLAEQAKPIAALPDPPKAPKPVVPVETKPLPEIAKAPEAAKPEPKPTAKKPPSPNTKTPAQVGLDPNAGLKHVSESQRAKGWMYQQLGLMLLRLSTLGMFGNGAAVVANTLQADATLMTAAFELAIPLAINGGTLATSYVLYWWGQWATQEGRSKGSQALYI